MAWYLVLAGIVGYLILGVAACLLFKRIKEFAEYFTLDDPIPMAGVSLLWPLFIIILIFYILMSRFGYLIWWINEKLGGEKDGK